MKILRAMGQAVLHLGLICGALALIGLLVAGGIVLLERAPVFAIALFSVVIFACLTWVHYEDA